MFGLIENGLIYVIVFYIWNNNLIFLEFIYYSKGSVLFFFLLYIIVYIKIYIYISIFFCKNLK